MRRFGCTWKLASVIAATAAASPHHSLPAKRPARASSGASVFSATHSAPCSDSASNAAAATSRVYQSRMPGSGPIVKSVHSGRKKYPSASSGTPRTTLPSAAPKKTMSSALAPPNTTSQNGCHSGLST